MSVTSQIKSPCGQYLSSVFNYEEKGLATLTAGPPQQVLSEVFTVTEPTPCKNT